MLCGMDKLPPDLRQYVKDDNELFEHELKEWDVLQALQARQEKALAVAPAATSACSIITSPASPQPVSSKSSPAERHGQGSELLLHTGVMMDPGQSVRASQRHQVTDWPLGHLPA